MTTTTEDPKVRVSYEVMAIISSNVGSDDVAKMVEEIKKMITSTEGEITNEDFWGLRDLAYKIKGQEKGYYVVINFQGPADSINEITKDLKLEQNILRFLLTKTQKNYVFRTLGELEQEAAKYREERAKRAAKKDEKKPVEETFKPKKAHKPVVEEKKTEKIEKKEPKEEIKEEVIEEPPKKKTKSSDKDILEDFDAKLKSLIDDPDITI